MKAFSRRVVEWQARHGRQGLPWQGTRDPYRLWLSEVMLQQTQVSTVIPYYERFLARFPDVAALARSGDEEVMALWSGLGYYARARNLLAAARRVVDGHGGRFPLDVEAVAALPGIGRSTASAIVAFATGEPHAILDGNVKRVLARHAGIAGPVDSASVIGKLWQVAESRLPKRGVEAYTQGIMDLGATVCTRSAPACDRCPVRADCVARIDGRVDELPGRKATRAAKSRSAGWLVARAGRAVLLERQPSPGLWGGLWALPPLLEGEDAAGACARLGLVAGAAKPLPAITHPFTHFTLVATPWLVEAGPAKRTPTTGEWQWLDLADAADAALPAPVKRLLLALPPKVSRRVAALAGTGAGSRGARRRP